MNVVESPSGDVAASPMKVLVVDDHVLVRSGMAKLLGELYPGTEVIEAANAADAVSAARQIADIRLVLLDLTLPDDDGFSVLGRLGSALPDAPVAVVTASECAGDIVKAYKAGARGYIAKSAPAEVLSHALAIILAGETYVPAAALQALNNPAAAESTDTAIAPPGVPSLTPRQKEILILLARGLQNKDIAERLDTVEGTVKVHVKTILEKLGVGNRTHAVVKGIRLGLIPADMVLPGSSDD